MKTKLRPAFQYAFAAILFFSWLDYQSITSDITAFEEIEEKNTLCNSSVKLLEEYSESLINEASDKVAEYPKHGFVYEKMKKVKTFINGLSNDITQLQDMFYQLEDEVKYQHLQKEPPAASLPINYNQEADVIEVFREPEHAIKFSWSLEQQLEELEDICKITKNHFRIGFENAKQYNEELSKKLDKEENIIAYILNVKQFKKDIQNYDVVHANALMNALKYQLRLLELELIQQMFQLIDQKKDIEVDIMLMTLMNEQPAVDATIELEICPMNYFKSEELEITLNGKELETKNGLATFQYTPKTNGYKLFDIDISLTSPFTGKTTNYKRTLKNYAIE